MKRTKSALMAAVIAVLMLSTSFLAACTPDTRLLSLAYQSGVSVFMQGTAEPDTSTLKATATYSDGETKTINRSDLTVGAIDTSTVGLKEVKVSYEGKSFQWQIEIKAALLSLAYRSGESVFLQNTSNPDTSTLKATATYADGTTLTINRADLTVGTIDTSTLGPQQVEVSFGGKSFQWQIEIREGSTLVSLAFHSGTSVFVEGTANPDISSLKALATFSDGATQIIAFGDLIVGDIDTATLGMQTVTVSFAGKSFEWQIEIKSAPVSLEFYSGTSRFVQNTEPDLSTLKALATYSDGTTQLISSADLTVGAINTATLGTQTVTVSFAGKSFQWQVVIEKAPPVIDSRARLVGYEAPQFVTVFEGNSKGGDIKDESIFFNQNVEHDYYVGTDNPFVFFPVVSVLPYGEMVDQRLDEYASKVTVEKLGVSNFELLDQAQTATFIKPTSNISKGEFEFTSAAVGEVFRITQSPNDSFQMAASIKARTISHTFKVVEGWNAYKAEDLSRIDNVNAKTYKGVNATDDKDLTTIAKGVWADYKNARGIPLDAEHKAVILHNDISLTMEDIPAVYKSGSRMLEIINGLYSRETKKGDSFSIIGNYFTVDASKLATQFVDPNKFDEFLNSRLISFTGRHDVLDTFRPADLTVGDAGPGENEWDIRAIEEVKIDGAQHTIKNIRFIGNGPRKNDVSLSGFGALQLLSNTTNLSDLTVSNMIALAWNVTFDLAGYNTVNIEDTKVYDNYSLMFTINNFGTNNYISNCQFLRSGAAIFSVEGYDYYHTYFGADANRWVNRFYREADAIKSRNLIHMDHLTELGNNVSGNDPWFKFGGTGELASTLAAYDMLVKTASGGTKTTLTVESESRLNFVALTRPRHYSYFPQSGIWFYNENGFGSEANVIHKYDYVNDDVQLATKIGEQLMATILGKQVGEVVGIPVVKGKGNTIGIFIPEDVSVTSPVPLNFPRGIYELKLDAVKAGIATYGIGALPTILGTILATNPAQLIGALNSTHKADLFGGEYFEYYMAYNQPTGAPGNPDEGKFGYISISVGLNDVK